LDLQLLQDMYRMALTIRRFEEAAIQQYRKGNIYGYLHPYTGEEGIAVGAISALQPDDYITSTHRGHGHALAKGHDLGRMMAELLGKSDGYCRGRGGSMHVANLEQYNLGANGIVGGGIPIATGAAYAVKLKRSEQVVLCFFSDGAVNNGTFHESVNMAAIYRLPVIYIIENNHYAVSTSVRDSTLVANLSDKAAAYGIPGVSMEGNDAAAVYEAMREPLERARGGQGPTLMEFKTYRHGGHHINDPGAYMPADELESWKAKDPLVILRGHLEKGGCSLREISAMEAEVEDRIAEAVQFALNSPEPPVEEFLDEIGEMG
jgi:TPP-dependent pyruvate/acetoin dehydrogenase alpha subunit